MTLPSLPRRDSVRRSSGIWAAGAAPGGATAVAPRAPHEWYDEACDAAHAHLSAGRPAEAAEAARRALDALPKGLEAQRMLGLALLELGDARPAANAFAAALGADPLDLAAQVGLAEAVERLEGAGAAEAAWRRAWELEPGAEGVGERLQAARRAAGVLDVQAGPPPLTRPALARIHLRGGLYEHAVVEARAALGREPERVDSRLSLAEAFWRSGDADAAAAVAAEIVEKQPDCVAANLLLAVHWQAEGLDTSDLLAHIRAVDPAGTVARRLFDDRELPAPFGIASTLEEVAAPEPGVVPSPALMSHPEGEPEPATHDEPEPTVVAEPVAGHPQEPAQEPALADTQPLAVVEPPPREVMIPEAPAEPEPVADVAATPDGAIRESVQAEELVELTRAPDETVEPAEVAEVVEAAEAVEALEPAETPGAGEPVGVAAPGETAEPLGAARAAAPVAAGPRDAGHEAMRAGRYFDAAREYGAWLRSLRANGAATAASAANGGATTDERAAHG